MRTQGETRARPAGGQERGRRYCLIIGLLTLLALVLRLAFLTFQPLWWDEGWSVYFAATHVGKMLELTAVDIHPPLYYLLLHLWTRLFGSSVLSVRLLSVLIGSATVPLIYAVGRRLLDERGGLLAALLLAISPFHIYYSQEVRMYGLVTLLGLAAFWFALREEWTGSGRRWAVWLGYVLAATAALYADYYAAFLLLALNLSMMLRWLRSDRTYGSLLAWLSAQVAVVLLYLPWLWYAGGKLLTYVRFKVSVEEDPPSGLFSYITRHTAAFNLGHAEGALTGWWWVGLLPLALLLVSLTILLRDRERRARIRHWIWEDGHWPLLIVVVAIVCGFAVNLGYPFAAPRIERLLLLALPAYLLLVAALLLALWTYRRWLAALCASALLIVAFLSLIFFYTVPRYPDDDYRPLAAQLRAQALPTDGIVAVHPWQVGYLQAYIPDDSARPASVLSPREVLPEERQLWAGDPARMSNDLDELLAGHGRLWLLDHRAMGRVLEAQVEAYLAESAYPVQSEWYGENTVLSLFSTGEPAPRPVTARFGEWLALDGAALSPEPQQAGWGVVAADLAWRLLERPGERYHVGLRLTDPAGRVWAQRDAPPVGGLHQFFEWPVDGAHLDRHGLLVPAGTPPGDYQVTLRVYRSHDVAVLPATFEGGGGGEVTLGTVRVIRPEEPLPVEALVVDQPLQADFGDRLRLLGFALEDEPVLRPGEAVEVDLFWQALADPGQDFYPRLQLRDSEGVTAAELVEKPVAGSYPTAWWQAGELVRDPHAVPIPASTPAGSYRLELSLIRAEDGAPVEIDGQGAAVGLAEIEVQSREHLFWPTFPDHTQSAQLGSSVELVGYDLREAVRAPGSPLGITLHWHALETPDRAYHSFVHLIDDEGQTVAQADGVPGGGELPALGWLPGEYLTDIHDLQIPFELEDGEYQLGVGLYDPATGQRLGERILLDTPIPVKASGGCNCR